MAMMDDSTSPNDPTSGADSGSNESGNSDDEGSSSSSADVRDDDDLAHRQQHDAITTSYPAPSSSLVTYQPGSIPLVLSAPHGGKRQPTWVPDLTERRHVADAYTLELTQMLASEIALLTKGHRRPFVVTNRLHRRKMDANREVNRGTEGGAFASAVYDEYHAALERACEEAGRRARACSRGAGGGGKGSGTGLLIDVHGYAPPKAWRATDWDSSWIMVGHLVSASTLAAVDDSALGEDADWVRGDRSMGALLERHGLMAEPSARRRVPTVGKYFSGGYITRKYRKVGTMRTLQLEFPRSMRESLDDVVPKVARAVVELMHTWDMLESN